MHVESEAIELLGTNLIKAGLAQPRELVGCSEDEIAELERNFEIVLPAMYKDFLRKMGRGAGSFMRGTDIFYRSLFNNRSAMTEVLCLDGNPFPLPRSTFVFSSHQGYIFHYFDTLDGNPDPPVNGYAETELTQKPIDESLSSFLFGVLKEETQNG